MEKLFLIFLSSTFKDLEKERADVAEAMRLHGYVPMGMENFTPTGEAQWDIIRRAIDKCDYYVLIIGGRYGSLNKDGISYTEAEYNYAKEKGLPVLAFIHDRPEDISVKNTDEYSKQLKDFRKRLEDEYYVGHWNDSAKLPTLIISALAQTLNIKPAIGWVRADKTDSAETLGKLAKALAENASLKAENDKLEAKLKNDIAAASSNITGLDDKAEIQVKYETNSNVIENVLCPTWKEIFIEIAPDIEFVSVPESEIEDILTAFFITLCPEKDARDIAIANKSFLSIRITFDALGLITYKPEYDFNGTVVRDMNWAITPSGRDILRKSFIARKPIPKK